jgi:tetratricopeptide (TPR) repeat protein
MAETKEDLSLTAEERWEKIENYFEENKKTVTTVVVVVVLAVAAYFGINNWYIPSQEAEAEVAMARAQTYFDMDSINKAINGDAANLGFEAIADQYSWTPAGHLANYYLGVCYYNKKDYQKALDYLEKFNAGDVLVSANAAGIMGDAEMQLNQPDKALEYYMEAVKRNTNNFTTPLYLKKAGLVYEKQGNYQEAVNLYERIKTEFHTSQDAQDIDKYIYRAKAKGGLM